MCDDDEHETYWDDDSQEWRCLECDYEEEGF